MFWIPNLILIWLLLAWYFFNTSSLNISEIQKGAKYGTKHRSFSPTKKPFLVNSFGSISSKPVRFMAGQPKLAKIDKLKTNKVASIAKHTIKTRFRNQDDHVPLLHQKDTSLEAHLEEISNDNSVPETSTFVDIIQSKTDESDDNSQNGDFSTEIEDWFDYRTDDNTFLNNLELTKHISHEDTFLCRPCVCSYTDDRFVVAHCAKKRLVTVPFTLPSTTIALNMPRNLIVNLNTSSFLQYPFLLNVTLVFNKQLTVVRGGSARNETCNVRVLNMTSCAISHIDDASFNIMPNLTHLIIRCNELTNLTQYMFEGLARLQMLDISNNDIRLIEPGTFDHLKSLLTLVLSGNKKLGYLTKRFPPVLFANLKQLQVLFIHGNTGGWETSYPDKTLQELVSLKELSVDGLGKFVEFGPEMQSLTNLVSLEIRGVCQIKNITEGFFKYLPYLQRLKIHRCVNFVYVHPKAYTYLVNLQTLSISSMKNYDIDNAFRDLTALNNSKLNSLTFHSLRRPNHQCKYMGIEQAKYIGHIKLVHLDLSGNSIALLGDEFSKALPKTLQRLILKENKFTTHTQSVEIFASLHELTELDLSRQNVHHYAIHRISVQSSPDYTSIPDYQDKTIFDLQEVTIDPQETESHFEIVSYGSDTSNTNLSSENQIILDDLHCADGDSPTTISQEQYPYPIIKIPPKLRILKASQYTMFGTQILKHILSEPNSLTQVDFSNSYMPNWGLGKLSPGITHANLSYNYCTKIKPRFFQPNNSLRTLFLNNNFLGPDFASDIKGKIFANLAKTTYLDLSTNLIYKLPLRFFAGLSNLTNLLMSNNKLSMLNVSFAHMKNLEFIDLSQNSISWIDKDTRNDLDAIAASSKHLLKVDLTMNSLQCTCAGLEVITWMATTQVLFLNKIRLTCYPDNRIPEPIGDLETRRQSLQRLCMGKSVLIIGCVAAISVVMVIVGFGLMYRYRWKLRYLHHTTMAALFGFKPDVGPESGCAFDAYFVYTDETRDFVLNLCLKELEQKRGHRLCVEDREFMHGTPIISSIVSAVRNSTKTVIVRTLDLFKEPYCEYSFQMAIMEELFTQRSVLHLLLYEAIANEQMSHDELNVMKRNCYTEYPPDREADKDIRNKFWDDLSKVIGHTANPKCQPVLELQ